jgi:hypothetical protein
MRGPRAMGADASPRERRIQRDKTVLGHKQVDYPD